MPGSATAGGFLLIFAIALPLAGVLFSLALGGRYAERVALILMPAGVVVAVAIGATVWHTHDVLQYFVGNWDPPLGVAFRADGLSATMMVTAALLICGIGLFARTQLPVPRGVEERAPLVFWTLLLTVWGALNAVFVGGDLFNLYVALELLTFAAVPLVSLDGRAQTLRAAFRYLLFALFGSILYLLGAVVLYGTYGTLDIVLLSGRIRAEPAAWAAISLMTSGLLAKAALYPLHLWLPPAHAGAPAPASAVLSGLVVKAPFFLVVRLWFDVMPGLPEHAAAQVLGALGAAAMFMAAGLIAEALGHDRIAGLAGVGRVLPITVFAFALGGLSLMGLPPSGGFVAKAMLLTAAVAAGQWWWAVVVLTGGLLAGSYVFLVLARAVTDAIEPLSLAARISPGRQAVVLALALGAVVLGFVPLRPLELLQIGRPDMAIEAPR